MSPELLMSLLQHRQGFRDLLKEEMLDHSGRKKDLPPPSPAASAPVCHAAMCPHGCRWSDVTPSPSHPSLPSVPSYFSQIRPSSLHACQVKECSWLRCCQAAAQVPMSLHI